MNDSHNERSSPFAALRRLALPKEIPEICEFCAIALDPGHRHLLELAPRKVLCVCPPCALRFENVVGGRFKLIPRDALALPDFHLTDAQWENLALPINLVFIFNNSLTGKPSAAYPSPAGATESLLPMTTWQTIVADNPPLQDLKPDVEALLIHRVGETREYFIAPMDACFELVGLIRQHWRGFSGGEKVWAELEKFFARLRQQARTSPKESPKDVYA